MWARTNPGFGCPCRATHPGLWKGSPRWGLPSRQATGQGARLSGHNTSPRTTQGQKGRAIGKGRAVGRPCRASGLWARTNPGFGRPHAKKPYRGGATPNRPANPNGRASPYRGDPSQSPGCVALQGRPNPGLVSPTGKEALQGRPLKRPWGTSWRPLWGRRPFALLEGRACRYVDRYSSAVPHSAQPRGRQGAPPSF